jgi:hypothetical protein
MLQAVMEEFKVNQLAQAELQTEEMQVMQLVQDHLHQQHQEVQVL